MDNVMTCICLFVNSITQNVTGGFSLSFGNMQIMDQTDRHVFDGFFARTTWVRRHQKGLTNLYFNEPRDDGWQWHQLHHMQITCTSLQTNNHVSTSSLNFLQA